MKTQTIQTKRVLKLFVSPALFRFHSCSRRRCLSTGWIKAPSLESTVPHAEEARSWNTGRISMETEVLDKEGRVEKRMWVRTSYSDYRLVGIIAAEERGERQ